MKKSIKIKLTAITLVICMLLSGSLMPISAVTELDRSPKAQEELSGAIEAIPAEDTTLDKTDLLSKEDSALWKFIDRESPSAEKHTARLEALEEPDTFVFQNSDGTRTVYFMEEDVKYTDSNGLTVIKDISLTKANNGFGIVRNEVGLLIPDKLTSGVDISLADYSVKLIPQNTATNVLAEQKNNSVVYNGVFGEKTALVYTPILSGIKEDIILSEYTENASYTFILKTNGLVLRNRDGKYCLFSLSKKDPVFYLGEILVYDSIGKPDMGSMTVETIEEGQEYLLTVTASYEFLSDPDTVYPVTIDPSISSSDSTTSGAIEDAVIFQNRQTENFGTYVYNRVGTPSASYGVGRTVVRLRGLLDSDEWAELHPYNVESLYFYATEATGSGSQTIMIYPLYNNATWTESTVTWNDIGDVGWYTSYDATMSYNQEAAFNITPLVTAWMYGDIPEEAGFIMLNSNESLDKSFCSSEYSNSSMRPRVVMTYTPMEGGNSFANATSLTSSDYVTAKLRSATDKRYFKFVPSATGFYTIESWENTADPYVRLCNVLEQEIDYDNNSAGYSNFKLTYHLVRDATYYFEIGCSSTGTGLFTFTLTSANDSSLIDQRAISFTNSYPINIDKSYKPIYCKYIPTQSGEHLFYSTGSNKVSMIWIYDSNLTYIDKNVHGADYSNFRLAVNLIAGQTYYIVAGQHTANIGSYMLRVLTEKNISSDVYCLKNGSSKLYLDVHGPDAQEYPHQWSFHTDIQNKWTIAKGTDGYYTIRSEYGNRYYVGVTSAAVDIYNVKLFSDISVNTQWKIYENSDGELYLEPRIATGMLLCTIDGVEGSELQLSYLSNYLANSNWLIYGFDYTYLVDHYFDQGFNTRYSYTYSNTSAFELLYSCNDKVAEYFMIIFGVQIIPSYAVYTSSLDDCKLDSYDSVSTTTINQGCEHQTNHQYNDILRLDVNSGNSTKAVVVWTGHIMMQNPNADLFDYSIVLSPNAIKGYEDQSNYEDLKRVYSYSLMHELSHLLGVYDHYCYGKEDGYDCCINPYCDTCVLRYNHTRTCHMAKRNFYSEIKENMYCSECMSTIRDHLADHH